MDNLLESNGDSNETSVATMGIMNNSAFYYYNNLLWRSMGYIGSQNEKTLSVVT